MGVPSCAFVLLIVLTHTCVAGVNYGVREFWNQMQENQYCASELGEEEYQRSLWHVADLQLEGGHRFMPKLEGAGYTHHG